VRLLLDTHIVIWQLDGRLDRIGRATETIRAADELLVSAITFLEIGIKAATEKLRIPAGLREHLLASGVRILSLDPQHGLDVAALPLHHRDPFDRVLISQARAEGLTIVTADRQFARYDVPVVAAGG
jgi:PIN domain nuclease of toxin-antitoxin system